MMKRKFFIFILLISSLIISISAYAANEKEIIEYNEAIKNFLDYDPFIVDINKKLKKEIRGKGIIIEWNSYEEYSNEIINKSKFDYGYSKNILRDSFAENPSQINFIIYIRHRHKIHGDYFSIPMQSAPFKYATQIIDEICIVNAKTKEIIAGKEFFGPVPPREKQIKTWTKGYHEIDGKPSTNEEEAWIKAMLSYRKKAKQPSIK